MNHFVFSGDDGDCIYACLTIRALGGGHLHLTPSTNMVRHPYDKEKAESIAQLLRQQDYIQSCEFATVRERQSILQNGGVDLDLFRRRYHGPTIAEWIAHPHNVKLTFSPWLKVTPTPIAPVVLHRSSRYQNPKFPHWDLAIGFAGKIVFVGTKEEHKEWCDKYGEIPYHHTKNFAELASVIAGSELFIGNLSAPNAVALGLGVSVVQETERPDNCRFERDNVQYVRNGKVVWTGGLMAYHDPKTAEEIVGLVDKNTVVAMDRRLVIAKTVQECLGLPGSTAELGVYKGGTTKIIAMMAPEKTCHAYDTFEGLPSGEPNGHSQGDFKVNFLDVRKYLMDCPNVILHKGFFPMTAVDETYCFAHIDCDLYTSCCSAIDYFWPRMVPGGYMVFDDYKWKMCPGIERAIKDRFPPNKIEETVFPQCRIKKT